MKARLHCGLSVERPFRKTDSMMRTKSDGATDKAAFIETCVQDELKGAVWAPLFQRRVVTRRYGPVWVVHPGADLREGGPWIYAKSSGQVLRIDFTSPSQRVVRIGAVLVLLVGVAVLVSRFYPTQWCGAEVTDSGATINICRDPEVTDPAIVALGVLVIAALGVFYTEISGSVSR